MSVSRRKGNAGKADMLFSRIVRSRGRCERCGDRRGPFDTAHVVRRRYSRTRCEVDNAWCLCRSCHRTVDEWAYEHQMLVEATVGHVRYMELRALANEGMGATNSAAFWRAEVERLTDICTELDIDTRWRTT